MFCVLLTKRSCNANYVPCPVWGNIDVTVLTSYKLVLLCILNVSNCFIPNISVVYTRYKTFFVPNISGVYTRYKTFLMKDKGILKRLIKVSFLHIACFPKSHSFRSTNKTLLDNSRLTILYTGI